MSNQNTRRFTACVSDKAYQNMKRVAKVVGVTQWELIEILLQQADHEDTSLKRAAVAIGIEKKNRREVNKQMRAKIRAKMSKMTPEQIKKALDTL